MFARGETMKTSFYSIVLKADLRIHRALELTQKKLYFATQIIYKINIKVA